jgi:hypothetical protein
MYFKSKDNAITLAEALDIVFEEVDIAEAGGEESLQKFGALNVPPLIWELVSEEETSDAWGNELLVAKTDVGFWVVSVGMDGRLHTEDDIDNRSHEFPTWYHRASTRRTDRAIRIYAMTSVASVVVGLSCVGVARSAAKWARVSS